MTWIKTIGFNESTGKLRKIYERVSGPDNNIDNILMSHSLRPHTLQGHMMLYKNVLHNSNNTLPKWFLEALGVYVSMLNKCDYCVDHHFSGMARLLPKEITSSSVKRAFEKDQPELVFEGAYLKALEYAKLLALEPGNLSEDLIRELRDEGLEDGEILEINQVVSYFCYANRTVLGLGINTRGDIIGLSPNDSDDAENWNHS